MHYGILNDLLDESDSKNNEEKKLCSEVIKEFLLDNINTLNIEELQKKFTLCLFYHQKLYSILIMSGNEQSGYSDKVIFNLYWKRYCEIGFEYSDFDEDFWHILRYIYYEDKVETRKVFTSHIKENIMQFIKNYTVSRIRNTEIYLLFHEYNVNPDSRGATETDIWIPNFITFLESIEIKSKELNTYIQQLKEIK